MCFEPVICDESRIVKSDGCGATAMPVPSHFRADPKTPGSGSADRHPLPTGPETQHVPQPQLKLLPYVVFQALIVTCRSAADNGALLIFPPWYTSGKLLYARKPDLPETAIR